MYKGTLICETGENLSHLSHIIPSNGKRKTLKISLKELRNKHGYTHVVVVIPKSLHDARVIVDVYSPAERTLEAHLPRFITFYTSQVNFNSVSSREDVCTTIPHQPLFRTYLFG